MAYSNGSATTPIDLLQQLVTFLVANGWTQDRSQTEGSGWTASLHKSGNYVHLRARMNEAVFQQNAGGGSYGVDIYCGTGFSSGQPWNNQTTGAPIGNGAAYPVGATAYLSAGPFTNHYFMSDSTSDNVVVVVEKTPGLFVFLGWGLSVNAAGAITGGPYFFGSSNGWRGTATTPGGGTPGYTSTSACPTSDDTPSDLPTTYVRVDVDSFTGKWVFICASSPTAAQGNTGKNGHSSVQPVASNSTPHYIISAGQPAEFSNEQTSAQDGRANLLPILLWANRDSTSTGYSLVGSLPMSFMANGVGNGFSNASEYSIGPDTYKMFPNFAVLKVV